MLWINNVLMPTPKSCKITRNKIWSQNAGRVASGKMVGDIIAIKYKLEIQWALVKSADVIKIDTAVSKSFFNVKFLDPATNSYKTIVCYAGDPSYPPYSWAEGHKKYTGVSVNLIEQ